MRKSTTIVTLALIAVIAACAGVACRTDGGQAGTQYEVMSPWAEADPVPLRGISPRIDTLEGKKIGIFANSKRSAMPQARMTERKLKGRFSTIQTDIYNSLEFNVAVMDTPNKDKFTAWINSVDAVVALVGD
jgi:hypothetical protein